MKIPKNSDITKYECFCQFVFKLLNLQMGTYRKILPWNPKLALMCTSPSVNLEKLQINRPKLSPFSKTSAASVDPKQKIVCTKSSFLGHFYLPGRSPGFHDPGYSPTRIHIVKCNKI
jgi:hypothetical protein